MNNTRVRRKASGVASYAIIKAGAENQQNIILVQRHIRSSRTVHSHHAQVIWSFGWHCAQAVYCRECRNLEVIEQTPQLRNRAGKLRSCAHERDRLFGLLEQRDQSFSESRLTMNVRRLGVWRKFRRAAEFHLCLQHVGGNVDHYGAGASAARPVKSFGDDCRNFFDTLDQAAPFGQRESHPENVCFLKRIRADQGTTHLAGDADQRNRIHFCVGNSSDEVRRSRPAGGKRNANFAADTRDAFSREDCSLLVAGKNVLDPAAFERVIQRHDRAARIAEHQVNALGTQALQNDFGSSKHSRPSPQVSALSRASWYLSAAMTSCRAVAHPRFRSGAAFLSRAGPQNSFRPSCSLQPTLWQKSHPECGREFLSLFCESHRPRLSRRESNRRTRPYWKLSSACGQVRLRKSDQRSASSHADIRNRRSPARSQPRPEFRILS